jgi:hypothetical protein
MLQAQTDSRVLRRFRNKIENLVLRYSDNQGLLERKKARLGIPNGENLTEDEVRKIEVLFNMGKKDNNTVQEKDLAIIKAINTEMATRIERLLTANGITTNNDKKFLTQIEAAKFYSAYKNQLKLIDLKTPKSLMLALDLLVLSYVLSGAISATSSVERLTQNWNVALWAILSASSGCLNAFSNSVFVKKLLEAVMENPQPNILVAALAVPAALTPSIPILNAYDIIPSNPVLDYFSGTTFVTLMPVFTRDFITMEDWMFQGLGYLRSNGLSRQIFSDTLGYVGQTKLQFAAGLLGRCLMTSLGMIQSYGYVAVPLKYFKIENTVPFIALMAARVPFVATMANNSIKILERLYKNGFSKDNLPDNFLLNLTGVFFNSLVTASIFLANSDLSKNPTKAVIVFIASVIAGSMARLNNALELPNELSTEALKMLEPYIKLKSQTVPGQYEQLEDERDPEAATNKSDAPPLPQDDKPISSSGSEDDMRKLSSADAPLIPKIDSPTNTSRKSSSTSTSPLTPRQGGKASTTTPTSKPSTLAKEELTDEDNLTKTAAITTATSSRAMSDTSPNNNNPDTTPVLLAALAANKDAPGKIAR